jgi:hypothetical protein
MKMFTGHITLACTLMVLLFAQCKEKEVLDADLIPAVDNLNTFFADTFSVSCKSVNFDTLNTSVKDYVDPTYGTIIYAYSSIHALGDINNDPIFGTTHASIALQLRQQATGLKFPKDSMIIDSLILSLPYQSFYGDRYKNIPNTYNVYRLNTALKVKDTLYNTHQVDYDNGVLLGSVRADVTKIDSSTIENGTRVRALRIPMSKQFAQELVALNDSVEYKDYETFRNWFRGIYITSANPNIGTAIGTFNFSDNSIGANMKLYYRVYKGTDTTKQSSTFRYDLNHCGHHNRIVRNSAGTKVAANFGTVNTDDLYMQSDCGAAIEVKLPSITQLKNVAINKADLLFSVIPTGNDLSDSAFLAPNQLRIVGIDSSGKEVRLPFAGTRTGNLLTPIGARFENGVRILQYRITLAKTIQSIITNNTLKLEKLLIKGDGGVGNLTASLQGRSTGGCASGRVAVGGPNRFAHKAKIEVIYTKLK